MQNFDLRKKLSEQLLALTDIKNTEESLQVLIKEFLGLKIYFLRHRLADFEHKWGMTYSEFETNSVQMANGFSYETEQEYYAWGETEALLKRYQKMLGEWI